MPYVRYAVVALLVLLCFGLPLIISCLPSARPSSNNHGRAVGEPSIDSTQHILPEALEPLGKIDIHGPQQRPSTTATVEKLSEVGLKKVAGLLKAAINESVDPCDNFYEFACGKWVASNPIPDDLTSYGHFSELREKVNAEMKDLYEESTPSSAQSINFLKQIYATCMDIASINAKKSSLFLKELEEFGYWPIVHGVVGEKDSDNSSTTPTTSPSNSKWSSREFNLTKLMIDIGLSRGIDVFVDVYVSLDQKNVTRRMLHFDQGGLGLGSSARDYYLDEKRYAKQMNAYERYMFEKIYLLRQDAAIGEQDNATLAANVKAIIAFEKKFAEILVPEAERRNFTRMYNLRRLSDLQTLMPRLDWVTYFRALMPSEMHPYLDSNPEVVINEPEFFQRLDRLLNESNTRVVADYILWRYTSAWSHQLDERYDDIHQTFLKSFVGRQRKSPRWKDCNAAAGGRMSYASGALYVRRYFDKQDREAALRMVEDLKEAFSEMLLNNDWMEESTRRYALDKALEMQSLIGFPDFIYNDTALDEYYANFTLDPTDDYATVAKKSSLWSQTKAFRRLTEPVDRAEFGTSSAVVNAFYSAVKNGITFPAAILQPPFFDRSFPKAVNYGGIGAVIGHEITHGFDDQGGQFDKVGNLENWWDPLTQRKFLNRTKCIIEQYSSYEVPNTGHLHINGILTQGENIADNGGIKQAYKAYRAYRDRQLAGGEEPPLPGLEHYSNDQIFFISYAQTWCGSSKPETAVRQVLVDPHSPMRFRVNGVVVNQPEFAKAFSCPASAPMNPEGRCAVW